MTRGPFAAHLPVLPWIVCARVGKEGIMTNKIVSIRPFYRISCTWKLTGDPRNPLACVWLNSRAPQTLASALSPDDVEGGLRRCA